MKCQCESTQRTDFLEVKSVLGSPTRSIAKSENRISQSNGLWAPGSTSLPNGTSRLCTVKFDQEQGPTKIEIKFFCPTSSNDFLLLQLHHDHLVTKTN